MDSRAGDSEPGADADWGFIETGILPFEPELPTRTIDALVGLAILRLRVYRGLSQEKLERLSGVDQTVISRLENGRLAGLRRSRFARLVGALGGLALEDPFPGWKAGHH